MANAQNLRIGDCDVFFNEVALGYTKGGVEFTFDREFVDMVADQHGTMPLDMVLSGQDLKIKLTLAEITGSNLAISNPEGGYNFAGSDGKVGFGRDAGYSLLQNAKLLRLHPRNLASTNRNEDIYIFKAVSVESVNLNYKIDEQRALEITFRALVDTSAQDGYRLGRIGDFDIS
jgi:hypothetical protein